ncbi:rRNA N-glycosidase [Striga asiatica]|uniref:rRNA N-glycosylase n=1 Tax=Striga asiatica TaxID=4170 RepID=A0A5A7RFF0_STRAF|nr:rRNA N-glycosidase [Striga asiatica]
MRPEAVTNADQLKLLMKLKILNFDREKEIVLNTRSDNLDLIELEREIDPSREEPSQICFRGDQKLLPKAQPLPYDGSYPSISDDLRNDLPVGREALRSALQLLSMPKPKQKKKDNRFYDDNAFRKALLSVFYHFFEAARFIALEDVIADNFEFGTTLTENQVNLVSYWKKASRCILLNLKFDPKDEYREQKLNLGILKNFSIANSLLLKSIKGLGNLEPSLLLV